MNKGLGSRSDAQNLADRITLFCETLVDLERNKVVELTADQRSRLDQWATTQLGQLATQYDVDTSASQKRVSWGMRIASTLGGLAICAAVVLCFLKYWGFLSVPVQIVLVMLAPLAALAGAEYAARRERTLYFAGLIALVALASFITNLIVLGRIFNIIPTNTVLLAWGTLAILLAYRYGLRPHLALGLTFLLGYGAALFTARLAYGWLDLLGRPEHLAIASLLVFGSPFVLRHEGHTDFAAVYRLVGSLGFFLALLSLAEWGGHSYLPLETKTVEDVYEFTGLIMCSAAIWLGITRQWEGVVNIGAVFFAIFLFCRLYHWWWDWMPKYLFFAIIGTLAILLVIAFRRIRASLKETGVA